jgi:hypothetical protein
MDQHVVFCEMCYGTIFDLLLQTCMIMFQEIILLVKFESLVQLKENYGLACHSITFGLCAYLDLVMCSCMI